MLCPAPTSSPIQQGVSLALNAICKTFPGPVPVVRDVSLEVPAGQFLSILGPSGCGKSTLLRMVAGLEPIDRGSIRIGSDGARPATAFVFQDAHLLPWRNLLRNVELPLELMGVSADERRERSTKALAEVGLSDALSRYPAQLSGGMRMRGSLARALVTRPQLLLLDEPFAALDEFTRQKLDEQLLELWRNTGMTVLFVTHSISEATFLGQRALVLSRRPATVLGDLAIPFPPQRTADLRTDHRFADVMHAIHQLMRGEEDA